MKQWTHAGSAIGFLGMQNSMKSCISLKAFPNLFTFSLFLLVVVFACLFLIVLIKQMFCTCFSFFCMHLSHELWSSMDYCGYDLIPREGLAGEDLFFSSHMQCSERFLLGRQTNHSVLRDICLKIQCIKSSCSFLVLWVALCQHLDFWCCQVFQLKVATGFIGYNWLYKDCNPMLSFHVCGCKNPHIVQ